MERFYVTQKSCTIKEQKAVLFLEYCDIHHHIPHQKRESIFLHTNLSRMNAVLVFFVMLSSFIIDTTLVIRMLIYLFMLAFIGISLIFHLHGGCRSGYSEYFEFT